MVIDSRHSLHASKGQSCCDNLPFLAFIHVIFLRLVKRHFHSSGSVLILWEKKIEIAFIVVALYLVLRLRCSSYFPEKIH